MNIQQKIQELEAEIAAFMVEKAEAVEAFRLKFLAKKGEITDLFEAFKTVDGEQKRSLGKPLNELKQKAELKWREAKELFENAPVAAVSNSFDRTLPGLNIAGGSRHPLSLVQNEIIDIFQRLGFVLSEGPEIEDDWHNFSALNFPPEHPARDMQDTFFINKEAEIALRTHTSSVQVRVMENSQPPIRTISPGRVYRNEAVSARANCFFHQVEGLFVAENVSFADLKQTLYYFVQEMFGQGVEIRFRPSYFPFTEPSAEMDISCSICCGTGCNVCKYTGWVEILGCGMLDPNVLENSKIDSEKYSGFAFGMGIERIAMLKYDVKDLRLFFEGDVRFLEQFGSEF